MDSIITCSAICLMRSLINSAAFLLLEYFIERQFFHLRNDRFNSGLAFFLLQRSVFILL